MTLMAPISGPGEKLSMLTLNRDEALSIEPSAETLFTSPEKPLEAIAAGKYLFCQAEGAVPGAVLGAALDDTDLRSLIIEQQKEGLWERFKMEPLVYIRRLQEGGRSIVQLWRPVSASVSAPLTLVKKPLK
jgi:hypothetical protein